MADRTDGRIRFEGVDQDLVPALEDLAVVVEEDHVLADRRAAQKVVAAARRAQVLVAVVAIHQALGKPLEPLTSAVARAVVQHVDAVVHRGELADALQALGAVLDRVVHDDDDAEGGLGVVGAKAGDLDQVGRPGRQLRVLHAHSTLLG
ncbi:hypothetical protein D3C87_1534970 [compost metagenome]